MLNSCAKQMKNGIAALTSRQHALVNQHAPPRTLCAAEAEALKQRIALEQARVGELEGLLAVARADEVRPCL